MGVRLFTEASPTASVAKRKTTAPTAADTTRLEWRSPADLNAAMAFLAHILPAAPLQAFLANGRETAGGRCVPVAGLTDYVGLYVGVRTDSFGATAVRGAWVSCVERGLGSACRASACHRCGGVCLRVRGCAVCTLSWLSTELHVVLTKIADVEDGCSARQVARCVQRCVFVHLFVVRVVFAVSRRPSAAS